MNFPLKIYTKSWSTLRSFQERWCSLGKAAWILCRWLEVTLLQGLGLSGSIAAWAVCGFLQGWTVFCPGAVLESPPGVCALARALRAPGCEAPSCKARYFTALPVLGVFQVPTHRGWSLAAPRWHPGSLLPRQKTLFWASKPVLGPFLLFRF